MNYREMRGELGMKRSMRFAAVMMAAVMTVGTASWQWLDGNHDGVAECYYFD